MHSPIFFALVGSNWTEDYAIPLIGVAAQLVRSGRRVLVIEADLEGSQLRDLPDLAEAPGFSALMRGDAPRPTLLDPDALPGLLSGAPPGAGLALLPGGGPLPSPPDPEQEAPWLRLLDELTALRVGDVPAGAGPAGAGPAGAGCVEVVLARLPAPGHPLTLALLTWCADLVVWLSPTDPELLGRIRRLELLLERRRPRPLPRLYVAMDRTPRREGTLPWRVCFGQPPDQALPPAPLEPELRWVALTDPRQLRAHHALAVNAVRTALDLRLSQQLGASRWWTRARRRKRKP